MGESGSTVAFGGTAHDRGDAPATIAVPIAPGEPIGRYTVVRRLGRGGMGVVYLARDPELDREIAIKLLRADVRGAAELGTRLLREARALARLDHPNIVRIFDVGTHDGRVFLAMELVDGETLGEWLASASRSRAEILAVFEACAAALASAHDAGLVHRDFKPSNVLIGRDARARVVDFGLALAAGEPAGGEITGSIVSVEISDSVDLRVTTTGMVVGTPAYMAAEQHLGGRAGPAADQFAFCVALWEALCGVRPFRGDDADALARSVLADALAPVPPGVELPGHVLAALRRGLDSDAGARWPDMRALARALRGRARGRRLGWVAAAVGVLVLGTAAWSSTRSRMCETDDARIGELWNDARAEALAAGFERRAGARGRTVAARVGGRLDRWASSWSAQWHDACVATHLDHRQSEAVLDARMACLERRRSELAVLLEVLDAGDGDTVGGAIGSTLRLEAPERCADPAAGPDHRAPDQQRRLDEARRTLARARVLTDAGRYEQARELAFAVPELAQQLDEPLLAVEASLRLGVLDEKLGHPEDSVRRLEQAAHDAAALGDDGLVVEAASALVYVLGFTLARRDEAMVWAQHAEAALARIGDDPVRRATLLGHHGLALEKAGRYPEAIDDYQRALAIWLELGGSDTAELARVQNSLGNAMMRSGDVGRARELYREAHDSFVAALGPDHPDVALALNNLGSVAIYLGEREQGELLLREAVLIWERTLGPTHPKLAFPLSNLASLARDRNQYEQSIALELRTLAIREAAFGAEHVDVAMSLGGIGYSHWRLGRHQQAIPLFERAIEIRERNFGDDHPELANSLSNLALVHSELGHHERAIEIARRSVAVREHAFGSDNIQVASSLHPLAVALRTAGRPAEAVPTLERALALREGRTIDAAEVAELQVDLAELLDELGREPARARALMEHARDSYVELAQPDAALRCDRWLVAHPSQSETSARRAR